MHFICRRTWVCLSLLLKCQATSSSPSCFDYRKGITSGLTSRQWRLIPHHAFCHVIEFLLEMFYMFTLRYEHELKPVFSLLEKVCGLPVTTSNSSTLSDLCRVLLVSLVTVKIWLAVILQFSSSDHQHYAVLCTTDTVYWFQWLVYVCFWSLF